jgi:hypothetical protein
LVFVLKSENAKRLLIILAICFSVFAFYDLFVNKGDSFDSVPTVLECLIIIGFSIWYFWEQLKNPSKLFLYNTFQFWIVVGFILFFSGTFFAFIYGQRNSQSPDFQGTFKKIMIAFGFIENILFLIAFIIARKQAKSIISNKIPKTKALI